MNAAIVRPDDWNLPLLLHAGSAMVFVGVLAAVAVVLVASRGSGDVPGALRLAFRTLLVGAIPSYILMRGAAEWIASEEDVDEDAAWIGIGYIVTDAGLLILIALTVLAGLGGAADRRLCGRPLGDDGEARLAQCGNAPTAREGPHGQTGEQDREAADGHDRRRLAFR